MNHDENVTAFVKQPDQSYESKNKPENIPIFHVSDFHNSSRVTFGAPDTAAEPTLFSRQPKYT
jgi:hypothetical protein